MIVCKDGNGRCETSEKNICCIDCDLLEKCKKVGCSCPTLRFSNTREKVVENCKFAEKEKVGTHYKIEWLLKNGTTHSTTANSMDMVNMKTEPLISDKNVLVITLSECKFIKILKDID